MPRGFIYIMTNVALKDMVKIGYATDVEARRKQLSTTALPYDYEVYATYETSGKLEDKKLHKLIDNLNPDLRVTKSREFFVMSPEDAFDLLETIAIISGTQDKLKKIKPSVRSEKVKRPAINFTECGIPIGSELVFTEDDTVRVTVISDRKVQYKNEITSLSAVAGEIKGVKAIAGPHYFTYHGETVANIAKKTQWK